MPKELNASVSRSSSHVSKRPANGLHDSLSTIPYKAIIFDLTTLPSDLVPPSCTKPLLRTRPVIAWGNPSQLLSLENAYSNAVGRNHHSTKRVLPMYYVGSADQEWIQDHVDLMIILPGQAQKMVV